MVEDTPDDLVHELFTQALWAGHALGRPILGEPETVVAPSTSDVLADFFDAHLRRAEPARRRRRQRRARARPRSGRPAASARSRRDGRGSAEAAPRVMPQVQIRTQGARAEPHLHRRRQLPAAPRRPIRELRPQHGARRLDELAPVPERAREARSRLRGVQRPRRVSRHRQPHDLRRLRQRRRRRGDRRRRRRSARHEGRRCPTPSCAARRIT